jgi:licheninase
VSKWHPGAWLARATFAGIVTAPLLWPTGVASGQPPGSNCHATAAAALGWGLPNRTDDFDDPTLGNWFVYDGPGHAGNGRRRPQAVAASNGVLSITGDAAGDSGGMALAHDQMYGRWEVCIKSSAAAPGYQSLALLWPSSNNWPADGEVDFMEIRDAQRQTVEANLHWGPPDQWIGGAVAANATAWHSWAVEWTPERIATFIDGTLWWQTTDIVHFPPGPMHLCVQLDNVGGDVGAGGRQDVDWVRQYGMG